MSSEKHKISYFYLAMHINLCHMYISIILRVKVWFLCDISITRPMFRTWDQQNMLNVIHEPWGNVTPPTSFCIEKWQMPNRLTWTTMQCFQTHYMFTKLMFMLLIYKYVPYSIFQGQRARSTGSKCQNLGLSPAWIFLCALMVIIVVKTQLHWPESCQTLYFSQVLQN